MDLVGEVFGYLTVLEFAGSEKNNRTWKCGCICGAEHIVSTNHLRCNRVRSCGCMKGAIRIHNSGGIPRKGTRLYNVWKSMRERCNNPKNDRYDSYGGRGISCTAFDDFAVFHDWAYVNGFADGLTLDRIDNDGDYAPVNCRWTTNTVQQRNKRNNRMVEVDGRKVSMAEAAEITGVPYSRIRTRLNLGWSDHDALYTPPMMLRRKAA